MVKKLGPKLLSGAVKVAKSKTTKKLAKSAAKAAAGVAADVLEGKSATKAVNNQIDLARTKISNKLRKIETSSHTPKITKTKKKPQKKILQKSNLNQEKAFLIKNGNA